MKYTTKSTVLEIVERPSWRMRLRDVYSGKVLSTRAEKDHDVLTGIYFSRGKAAAHKAYVAYVNSKGRKNPMSQHSFVIDAPVKGHKTLIRKLAALKTTHEIYFNGAYHQDLSLCQVIITTEMTENQLDHWLWKTKNIDYIGIAPYNRNADDLVLRKQRSN